MEDIFKKGVKWQTKLVVSGKHFSIACNSRSIRKNNEV